ncbi:MAG: DUF3127 domain-containing protein [Bacteroidales bacterium]|nr:DUF3127 domain-containing protein [Bacteroidales bacterium]
MDLLGKVIKIMPQETGNGANGQWKKQNFVVEYGNGQYPKKVCFQVWGDRVDFSQMREGTDVRVFFDPESREYNDKWYTDLRVWKVDFATAATAPQAPAAQPMQQSQPAASAPQEAFGADDGAIDDMPF